MKKGPKKAPPAVVENLDSRERELFLNAFFRGELEKLKPDLSSDTKIEPKEEKHKEEKLKEEEPVEALGEDERALFLQAVNTGSIGMGPIAPTPRASLRAFRGKKRKFADASLDLHGMVEEEAVRALLEFIKHEKVRGSKTLLVVHGKGTGVLRNAVWALLETHPMVADFQVAPSRFGGDGALIVRINRKMRLF